ncbi:glycosyltransferase family 2 protein [Helicobacter sp. 11S02629-2]|uniref:glycosyltransferase family 2 protein n=1 Tax=Helicobacter sp. 11S02629-2 TaxID=1476195 RepID=UPI000BA594E5|nr:glycosyltransferase family 2 protein [Helicobacter sp. 11S02629-2]PAF46059.1 hypothetical protein BKH40_01230 [Helicobacter sp. 11S02629-2]
MHKYSLSVIVPCYNEEDVIAKFYKELLSALDSISEELSSTEILFINDGSKDKTKEEVLKLESSKGVETKLINFSRNFGKESALLCGLRECRGDIAVIIDADLQMPPSFIKNLLETYKTGNYDMVYTKRASRPEGLLRKALTRLYYSIYNSLVDVRIEPNVLDYRILSRKVIDAILEVGEYHRFSKGIFAWVGFKSTCLICPFEERAGGVSKFNLRKLFSYGLAGVVSFSTLPLKVAFYLGFVISLLSFLYGIYMVVSTLAFGNPVKGYPSLIVIILFMGGIQIMILGIIGEYIARIYEQVKNRPQYFIDSTNKV